VIGYVTTVCVLFVIVQARRMRRAAAFRSAQERDSVVEAQFTEDSWSGIQLSDTEQMTHQGTVPLLSRIDAGYSSWAMMESSPAPIFVVNRDMHVSLWSPGMASAAPLPLIPVGLCLSELPFVNESSGKRLYIVMCDLFDMPGADHLNPQRIMLYLRTKEGPVLFEMAAHVAGAGSEAVIVVIGRTVESDLGLLIADERITPWTESESESKGDSGDYKEAANIDECQSEISSLTAPSFLSHGTLKSEFSSLTRPTISTRSIPCSRISPSSSSSAYITPTETSSCAPGS
jgi:hypothetical protein